MACLFVNVIFAIASIVPLVVYLDINPQTEICEEMWPNGVSDSLSYSWFVMIFYSIIPVIVIMILYIFIFQSLRASVSHKKLAMISDPVMRERRRHETRRVVFMLVVVVVVFVAIVFPPRILWVILDTHHESLSSESFLELQRGLKILSTFQVAVNPVIYTFMDRKWRHDLLVLLKKQGLRTTSFTQSSSLPSLNNNAGSSNTHDTKL